MNTFEFALDLSKQTAMEPLRLRQGDKNGTEVRATIYDHGTLVTGSYTSRICLGLPDGEHYYRKAGTFSAGVATVTIDEQEAASVVGRSYGYIQLLSGSTVIASTASFPVLVLPDATADATVPESYDTAIQEAIDGLNDAVADLPDTVEEILEQHPEWTTTVQDNSVTDAKLVQQGGILSRNARLMYRLANLLTHRTDEGTLAAISDAAKTPMAGLAVYGQSTQDGTPTPSAPVPIVSVEGDSEGNISLWAHGFNWWDGQWETGTIDATTGENSSATEAWRTKNYIPVLPSTTYYAKGTKVGSTDGWLRMRYYDSAKTYIGSTDANGNTTKADSTFVTPANARYVRFAPQNTQVEDKQVCINLSGPRNGEYQPYVGTTTPIDLDGHELRSLPDGTRDELTVDAEGHVTLVQRVGTLTFDGSESWSASSTPNIAYKSLSDARKESNVDNALCDHFAASIETLANMADPSFKLGLSGGGNPAELLYFKSSAIMTSVADLKTWLASNPTTVTYPLATPVTHDLGTVPLVPLVGPDLTAQTVPAAPFVLDAERDLNVTLARLESAIAALA